MLNNLITQIALVLTAVISSAGGIYSAVVSKRQNDANADKTEKETEQVGDKTWIQRLDILNNDFNRLQALSDERFERLVEIEMLITEHVSWDFKVLRALKEHGINHIENPPSLVYVRKKLKEAQAQEKATTANGEDIAEEPDPR